MAQPVKQNALVAAKAAAAKQPVKAQAAAPVGNPLVNALAQALHTLSQKIVQAPAQVQQALQGHPFIQTLGNAGLQLTSGGFVPTSTAGVAGAAVGGAMGGALQKNPVKLNVGTPDANGLGQHYGVSQGMNNIGVYTEPGNVSFGGAVWPSNGLPQVGGTIGVDHGAPYGSANVNGNIVGQFGPASSFAGQSAAPQNVYTKTNWDVSKLQPGQGFSFEDGSGVQRGPSGLIKTPPPKASVLGAATRRGQAKPVVRPPAVKPQQTTYAPYGEWKNTRGYDVLMKKGML